MVRAAAPSLPHLLGAVAVATAVGRGGGAEGPAAAPAVAVRPPLRTEGHHIVDANGRRVILACVNWYGAHLKQMAANGLNRQPLAKIAAAVVELGFNCVRLPFSLDLVLGGLSRLPDPNMSLAANPELLDLTPLEVFDATVKALTAKGVMVVLNNHVSSGGWCCSLTDGEGMWYTEQYPEDAWLRGIGIMAARYRTDPLVVGFDLRNEIRSSSLGSPTWGSGDTASDWSLGATRGAERVLLENEDMLIIISGLHFSGFLCDVPRRPVHELVPALRGRTVYTAHEYTWVNLHLQTRNVVGGSIATLAFSWVGSWLCAAMGWRWQMRRGVSCSPCRYARCGCSCGPEGACEFFTTAALTMVSIAGLGIPALMDKCSWWHYVVSMALLFLAFISCLVGLVLWVRFGVICVQQMQAEAGESAEDCIWPPAGAAAAPPPAAFRSRTHPASRVARSNRCLAFMVSGVLLGALGYTISLYGRYETFAAELDSRWGFLVKGGRGSGEAPVWVGEFGSSADNLWWKHMMKYMRERDVAGWAYWSLNGQKTNSKRETFGLLQEDCATVRHPWKLRALQQLLREHAGVGGAAVATGLAAPPLAPAALAAAALLA
mmetsp:Transcript_38482/g.107230  ORF Transcript_38482/g.107230 Transcript_38482/m.107230 type:complete len:603 (-) Transcript_38482:94-1902(-)